VYVVVVDGLDPDEVTALTPTLSQLKADGTWYGNARAVMIAETIPNHVAMMTGVLPNRSGIVANTYRCPATSTDPSCQEVGGAKTPEMDTPDLIKSDTLVTRLKNECAAGGVQTATVMSKTYLYGIFCDDTCSIAPNPTYPTTQEKADFHWLPSPVIPVSNHAPDAATMQAFLDWLEDHPNGPQFAFVNLGDVDRSGHADPSGNAGLPAFRQASLEHTDIEIGRLVATLKSTGAWESTVLIITSDHSMDWSLPQSFINLTPVVGAAGTVVQNGGADVVYLNSPTTANVAAMAATIEAVPGVAKAVTADSAPSLAILGLDHTNTGDIVAFAKDGYRFTETGPFNNPIPGNHGHAVTQASVLLVTGGHPALADPGAIDGTPPSGSDIPDPPAGSFGNLNVAPTVAALLGLGTSVGTYDAPPLGTAFDGGAVPDIGPCGS
jgi:hypothetical protein